MPIEAALCSIQQRALSVVARAELDSGHVTQTNELPLAAPLQDDRAEFLFGFETAANADQQQQVG
jgi:hypothetical protein